MPYKKPHKLQKGDTIAVISPSWEGPFKYPHIYENGLKILHEWGLKIKEYPSTRAASDSPNRSPQARAQDVNDAFADKNIQAIIPSIGGDGSVLLLPFLNSTIISQNPKILMGFSDTSPLLTYIHTLGLITFYGPSIMAGFSQMENLPQTFKNHVRDILFNPQEYYEYNAYKQFSEGYPSWAKPENTGKINKLKSDNGWKLVQGQGIVEGELFGGCIEVLEGLKSTNFWPSPNFWNGKILFFETRETKPLVYWVQWMLRNYGMQGIFEKISALLFGRPNDYTDEEKDKLYITIKDVVAKEFGRPDLPIITNMDFGHTDPHLVMPLGVKAQLDCDLKKFKLVESWLS